MLALSFRGKLTAIVVTAAVAFAVMIVSSSLIANRSDREIDKIQQRYLPKLALAPQIEGDFERLRRALQDAVGARDVEALSATRALFEQILAQLASARDALDPRSAETLTQALSDYYQAASEVSRRLIAGETGEGLVSAMSAMQAMQTRVAEDLKSATTLDRGELARAFASAARAQVTAGRVRFAISALCLLSVILLSVWVGRGLLRSLDALAAGLGRFGRGDFARPIEGVGADELGQVAQQANRMADSLRRMGEQRERASWIKNLEAGLGQELRGALDPDEVAGRAVGFLARALEARAAALYYADPGPSLRLLAHYALSPAPTGTATATAEAAPSFGPGEGLVGQAALQEQVMLVNDPPPGYLRVRSGLGEAAPRVIALVPLVHVGKASGVLELALFSPWSERSAEAVQAVQEMLVIAIEVARSRAATRQLLAETQRQAQRLTEQEEELRATNDELHSQQHELKQSNRELTNQADELEAQRTKLEESNRELDDARRGLELKARELATVSTYKSQFLANMSHELRTPLNSMLLLSNLLAENQSRNLTDKQVEFAATIHAAGRDLLALINQVLDLAKIESGKSEVQIAPAPLRDLVTSMERVFAPLAADKGLRLRTEIAPGLPESIATDRRRVEQILKNLIGNAIKFTERGEVVVQLGFPGPAARLHRPELQPRRTLALSVSDTGVGIAPEHRERVFVPFEQVDSAPDRRYGGTGLGLSISRELAALLGGELHLHSEVGRGSTFICYLPFDPPAAAVAATPASAPAPALVAPPAAAVARAARGNGHPGAPGRAAREDCLLVIEDDPAFGEALADIIRGQGLQCLLAEDGQSGLRLARERRPAGIILDVMLPDLDGWRIMERLRADPATAAIPVHFVSGVDTPDRGMALGAVGYLTKPAAQDDLARAVRALSVKGTAHARRVLVVEDDVVVGDALERQLSGEMLEVRRAGSAGEARAALETERFGCMILELSLPDMDGLQLLRALRERHGARMPAVVIHTARALTDDEARTLETYAEAVVLKDGASAERLLDEVRVFVRRLQDGRASTRRVAPAQAPSEVHLEGKKVLIVDDDMRTVYALSATLRAKGADVAVAENGQMALTTLADRPDVQAVLMDIMMPGMDGYETIRRIRRDGRHGELPIIALTAKAMKGDQEQCLASGASDYLPKPIDVDRLLQMLDRLLSPVEPRPLPP
ncbi:MAG TPA: response regulator [Polyangia bacterium]|nr:response regulator [Polyangia bacterium]